MKSVTLWIVAAAALAAQNAVAEPVIAIGTASGAPSAFATFDPAVPNSLFPLFPPPGPPNTSNSVSVALGDVTGDGIADVVTGLGESPGLVAVYDLMTFGPIFVPSGFTGGVYVAAGDINGDGKADVIAGNAIGGNVAALGVAVTPGPPEVLRSFSAYSGFTGDVTVAAGDINGDGTTDIITGQAGAGNGHVKVFDGRSGSEVSSFFAYGASFVGGVRVAAGDVNGDSFADIIVGAGPGAVPHVKVFSGATGQTMHDFFAYDVAFRGGVNVGAGDVNGDGQIDIFTAPGPGGGDVLRIFERIGN